MSDPVNHPDHYTAGAIECIDAIEAALGPEQFAGFCRGNAMKYLWRVGRKGEGPEDVLKAIWYTQRLADGLRGEATGPADGASDRSRPTG